MCDCDYHLLYSNVKPDKKQIIIDTICNKKKVNFCDINIKSRNKNLVYVRHLIMFFLIENGYSLSVSSYPFNKDHTSALHSKKTIKNRYETEKLIRFEVDELRQLINNNIN